MTPKRYYQQPETDTITICLERNMLDSSVLRVLGVTGGTPQVTGENITFDSEYNPW